MQVKGCSVVILGGSGLVGMAIARRLLPLGPARVVLCSLARHDAEGAVAELRGEAERSGVELVAEWGDIFVPHDLKDRSRADILADPEARARILDDLYDLSPGDAVAESALGHLFLHHRPQLVVDCINTATVIAYQDVYGGARRLRADAARGTLDAESVERHLASLYMPQLIRHAQVALEALRRADTRMYLKIGTAGTGGMGLNIPFTHSEDRPSRPLLAKASIAGAQTLLLFLMARTPGALAVKEIKPTAAISWKRIAFGEVVRGGRPVRRVDSLEPLSLRDAFDGEAGGWRDTGEALRGVFVDAGENGLFSPPEFEALTALGLMEFITPEEIAQDAVREIQGQPSGHDVVAALDASSSGPTYRAGVLRRFAMDRMDALEREQGIESVAYEMLGPPRLSKLLFEASILSRLFDGELRRVAELEPDPCAAAAAALIEEDADLRSRILSIGLPILLPDGERVLRGADVKVPPPPGEEIPLERMSERGWVDLRPESWSRWRDRAVAMVAVAEASSGADAGSSHDIEEWHLTGRIRPGAVAAWVFRHEDRGERIKR